MPIVHVCSRPGCGTLTMGDLCWEHEQESLDIERRPLAEARRVSRRLVAAAAFVAVAGVGGLVRLHLPR